MASPRNKARLLGAIATVGSVVGYFADALEGSIPSFHRVLQQPAMGIIVTIIALATTTALVL